MQYEFGKGITLGLISTIGEVLIGSYTAVYWKRSQVCSIAAHDIPTDFVLASPAQELARVLDLLL
jgi:hypothetical protein